MENPMDQHDDARRRVGRPPKYDWGDKRDICYKLWVEEQKSATEITKYFADHFNVAPSELPCRKGFLRQFQLWGFPSHSKKMAPEDEAQVLARVRELWEQNVNQKDIKATLAEEGWLVKDYEFAKLWKTNGLRLRNEQGYRPPDPAKRKRKRSANTLQPLDSSLIADGDNSNHPDPVATDPSGNAPISAPLNEQEANQRAQRLFDLQMDSDMRLQSRKRRRRIRGYGHLPPDAPGTAPRYRSETSLDECKAYLHLSNDMYTTIRKDFTNICEEMGIVKKTECADGVWEKSKSKLILENLHLAAMMHPLQPDQDKKTVALDCLCCDVTKRMRVAGKAITISEANNMLGLNPTESKAIRRSLYEILANDNFESRLVCGDEHWKSLRQRWYATNEKLQQIVDENEQAKIKAVDLLCSDAMKRFREDKNKRGERPVVQKNAKYGPGPGPAWAGTAPRSKVAGNERAGKGVLGLQEPHTRAVVLSGDYPPQDSGNFISTLAQAAGDIDFDLDPALAAPEPESQSQTPLPGPFVTQAGPERSPTSHAIPAYFRLSPASTLIGHHPRMWLGKLTSISVPALHRAATAKAGAANVSKVQGLVKSADGSEDSYLIDTNEELEVYLEEAGEKASFIVTLEGGYA